MQSTVSCRWAKCGCNLSRTRCTLALKPAEWNFLFLLPGIWINYTNRVDIPKTVQGNLQFPAASSVAMVPLPFSSGQPICWLPLKSIVTSVTAQGKCRRLLIFTPCYTARQPGVNSQSFSLLSWGVNSFGEGLEGIGLLQVYRKGHYCAQSLTLNVFVSATDVTHTSLEGALSNAVTRSQHGNRYTCSIFKFLYP